MHSKVGGTAVAAQTSGKAMKAEVIRCDLRAAMVADFTEAASAVTGVEAMEPGAAMEPVAMRAGEAM